MSNAGIIKLIEIETWGENSEEMTCRPRSDAIN